MAKTFVGKAFKALSVMIATVILAGCVFMFTACESKYPKISIKISFNNQEYTLEYKLYRNLYSQTVAHYIELIDLGYFDNTVIHDFQDDRMVGGGYTYEVGGQVDMTADPIDDLTQLDYDALMKNDDGSLKLKHISVWEDEAREKPTNRLYGETSDNAFSIDNDTGLKNTFGALGTYTYVYDVKGDANQSVYVRQSSGNYATSRYYKNSFQGMFYIYTSNSTSTDKQYCVFGELMEDSETELENLLDAIDTYKDENDAFTKTNRNTVIKDSMVSGGRYEISTDFEVPLCKIIIEEVKVLNY